MKSQREDRARVLAFYNSDEEQRHGGTDWEQTRALVDRVVDTWLSERDFVVELGCGTARLADCHPRYVGVDLSRTTLASRTGDQGTFVQSDIQRLPLANRSSSFVFSVDALEHVPHPERVLEEIDRILRSGGFLLLDPAWFCRPWFAEALGQRSYGDLDIGQKIRKATLPFRNSFLFRAARIVPRRLLRELDFALKTRPLRFLYRELQPNLEDYLRSDSDAFSWMDSHEALLYFLSRGYDVLEPDGRFPRRLLVRHQPLLFRKPGGRIKTDPSGARPSRDTIQTSPGGSRR